MEERKAARIAREAAQAEEKEAVRIAKAEKKAAEAKAKAEAAEEARYAKAYATTGKADDEELTKTALFIASIVVLVSPILGIQTVRAKSRFVSRTLVLCAVSDCLCPSSQAREVIAKVKDPDMDLNARDNTRNF